MTPVADVKRGSPSRYPGILWRSEAGTDKRLGLVFITRPGNIGVMAIIGAPGKEPEKTWVVVLPSLDDLGTVMLACQVALACVGRADAPLTLGQIAEALGREVH